jgi:hypothetical protein
MPHVAPTFSVAASSGFGFLASADGTRVKPTAPAAAIWRPNAQTRTRMHAHAHTSTHTQARSVHTQAHARVAHAHPHVHSETHAHADGQDNARHVLDSAVKGKFRARRARAGGRAARPAAPARSTRCRATNFVRGWRSGCGGTACGDAGGDFPITPTACSTALRWEQHCHQHARGARAVLAP